jgi:adenylate cyclase class 2
MGKEYEAKFLNINISQIRKKLLNVGANLIHGPLKFSRVVFTRCSDKENSPIKGFVRIRNEGKKITMTVKTYRDPKFPDEYEVSINEDFNTGLNFLKTIGINQKSFQESYREKWTHPLAHEITIDIIPGLPIYMEVDCTSEENLDKVIKLLGLDDKYKRYGAFDKTYNEYYGIDLEVINDKTESLTFSNIKNEINPTKNLDLLDEISLLHKELNKYHEANNMNEFYDKYMKIYNKYLANFEQNRTKPNLVRKPSKKTSKKTSKKPSKKPSKKTSKKPSKKSSKKPSKKVIKKTSRKVIKK